MQALDVHATCLQYIIYVDTSCLIYACRHSMCTPYAYNIWYIPYICRYIMTYICMQALDVQVICLQYIIYLHACTALHDMHTTLDQNKLDD